MDASVPLNESDEAILEMIKDKKNIILLNKSDLYTVVTEEMMKERFEKVVSIHVIREDYVSPLEPSEQNHVTELALDDYDKFDYKIVNFSLKVLENDIIKIIDSEVI